MSNYIVRPSAASQRLKCPGSLILEQEAPPEEESEYAAEGTLAHEYAAEILNLYFNNKQEHIASVLERIEDIEMMQNVHNYYRLVQAVDTKVGGFDSHWVEMPVEFNQYMGGTSDCGGVYDDGKRIVVMDYKNGAGVSVVAEENYQLIAYMLGVINTLKLGDIESATLIIYQPRARDGEGAIRDWTIRKDEIRRYRKEFEEGIQLCRDVYYGIEKPIYKAGDHCLWCRAKPFCKAFKDDIKEKGVIALEKQDFSLPSPDKLTKEQIRDIWLVRDRILELFRAIEPYVIQDMEKGNTYPGLKIVAGKSNRAWKKDLDLVESGLKQLGIDEPSVTTKKLMTIGQAEKILGKNKIGHLTVKPPGKPKLVRDDDPRAEVHLENPNELLDDIDVEDL